MTKPRSDSKLFTLPADDQLVIFEWMKHSSYKAVRVQIRKEYSINVSVGALSNAWDKWSREEFEERVMKSKGLAADVIDQISDEDMARLDRATQAALQQSAFELSMNKVDPKTVKSFYTLLLKARKLDQDDTALQLQVDRFQFDAAKAAMQHAAELKSIAADKTMNDDAKIAAVRRRLFGAIPEDANG